MRQLLFTFLWLILLSGCESYNNYKPSVEGDIVDKSSWYEAETGSNVLEVRVTIPTPNDYECKPFDAMDASPRPCTLEDVLADKDPNDAYEPELHIHFESDAYLRDGVNAKLEQKGKSTRAARQASFRVKLDTKTDLYDGERTFQLNKHFYDDTRVANMLSFELFQSIPHFTSLRTRFMHLHIDGVDYGLFTHVEHGDKLYLKNHGFSKEDNLYKAQNYAFVMTKSLSLGEDGKPLDQKAFDATLEMKSGKEIQKVVEMTQAIADATTDAAFETVFNKYFNRQNYLTWFAINIILGNKDTVTQNFFLLNPKFSDTFYFLPWDYDGIGYKDDVVQKWTKGIANWWQSPLHRKFLQIKKNRDDLDAMVATLRAKYITDEAIHALMDKYRPLVEKYVTALPDSRYLHERWAGAYNHLRNELVSENLKDYNSQKGHPMPFWQYVENKEDGLILGWGKAVDLENDAIVYSLEVSESEDFNTTIINEQDISSSDSRVFVDSYSGALNYKVSDKNIFQKGVSYFMRVIAYEALDRTHYQIAFDNEVQNHPGILEFRVE